MPKKPSPHTYRSCLSINRLVVDVNLGLGPGERRKKQRISIDIKLYIPHQLSSFSNDNGEYICYHGISEKINTLCSSGEFKLIEFLTMEIYRLIRKEIESQIKIKITLNKLKILLPYVENGSSFSYTDLPPFSWVIP